VSAGVDQRLAGLDGVRRLAALVVVNHIFLRTFPGYPVDRAPFWARRFHHGVSAFAVTVALVLPPTIGFARVFAAVFETPSRRHRGSSGGVRRRHPQAEGAPA
jgi:peptidoglycan/LPS O-acetylase OafA/YrhL